jgi:hypothetical protein
MDFITKYLFSGWDQAPFLGIAILLNVVSGIIASNNFDWRYFANKIKDKLIFYGISFIAIHVICFLPIDGRPLFATDLHIAIIEVDLNVFKSLNLVATLYISTFELLSTDANIYQKYQRHFIPKAVSDLLQKFVYGEIKL